MRRVITSTDPIWTAWEEGGAMVGDKHPHVRVTVEPGYQLRTFSPPGYARGPVRWWQDASNNQYEVEVPNVQSLEVEYSIDSDAATCTIKMLNARPVPPDQQDSTVGPSDRGYYTPWRGQTTNRWGLTPNEWTGLLGRNALLRTYEGFGGLGKSIPQGVADGNLVLTGVWLVDKPQAGTDGILALSCRNMAKLLIDQEVFAPLVPSGLYPLSYSHFVYSELVDPKVPYGSLYSPYKEVTGFEVDADGQGYWVVGDDGGVFSYGSSLFHGSSGGNLAQTEGVDTKAVDICRSKAGDGYWVLLNNGGIFSYGDAVFHGSAFTSGRTDFTALERSHDGYWLLDLAGEIYAYNASYLGNAPLSGGRVAAGLAATPTENGYWICDDSGAVFAFGDAGYYGGTNGLTLSAPISGITGTPSGHGYWLVSGDGGVFAFGDAGFFGSPSAGMTAQFPAQGQFDAGDTLVTVDLDFFLSSDVGKILKSPYVPNGQTLVSSYISPTQIRTSAAASATGYGTFTITRQIFLVDPVTDIVTTPDGGGYWLVAKDGGVFAYGNAGFWGSLPGYFQAELTLPGNLPDYKVVIEDLALWAGFNLYDGTNAYVYGNIESTGAYPSDPANTIDATVLDAKPVIDGMKMIRDLVGYVLFVDDQGALIFREPNYWQAGNDLPGGTRTVQVPVIDERVQLTQYQVAEPDSDLRSDIIISSDNPYPDDGGGAPQGTVTTHFVPSSSVELKGMVKPAMWVNAVFADTSTQATMAQLIAIHTDQRSRQGSLTCLANPLINIDDQVQILERDTSETNYHYVRTISRSWDRKSGHYTMQLTTNYLSGTAGWIVTRPSGTAGGATVVRRP